MDLTPLVTLCVLTAPCSAVRLQKLFEFLDGTQSESNLQGFLHVGNDYTIFLRKPTVNDEHLIYELYETLNTPNSPPSRDYKPTLLAISEVPVAYLKDQLHIYRGELHNATHYDSSLVPGTQVRTLREWQIDKALRIREKSGLISPLRSEPLILRAPS